MKGNQRTFVTFGNQQQRVLINPQAVSYVKEIDDGTVEVGLLGNAPPIWIDAALDDFNSFIAETGGFMLNRNLEHA